MVRKCAIYNRLSVENDEMLKEKREELIEYCKDILKIDKYVIFEEISSLNSERYKFNEMLKRISEKEFTDILVFDKNRIYRINYDRKIYNEIFNKIFCSNAKFHSITEPARDDMNYFIDAYNDLVKQDKQYQREYYDYSNDEPMLRTIKEVMDNYWLWRTINGYDEIMNLLKENKGKELLRMDDYYSDEICEVYAKLYNKDFFDSIEDKEGIGLAFQNTNLRRILNDKSTPEQLKDCIKIYLKSEIICKSLYSIFYSERSLNYARS